MQNARVLVAGDVMLDHYLWGQVERISPEAPVPVVWAQRETYTLGGAANVALNVRSLGALCQLAGLAGQDAASHTLCQHLDQAGIGTQALLRDAQLTTTVKTRVMAQNQQLCRIDHENPSACAALARAHWAQDSIWHRALEGVDTLIFSDYAKGCLQPEWVQRVCTMAREKGIWVTVDPKPTHMLPWHGVDLMTPNKGEAFKLAELMPSADDSPAIWERLCQAIYQRYQPAHLVITLGADGMLLARHGRVVGHIPAFAREVCDVSGAGDTVIAYLSLALSQGLGLEQAAHIANMAAGIVVGKLGTATTTPQEILRTYAT
jgi:D-beta-D-heptose 7-phosphate kinase/D-beta-D-heptose 1-phosphate adenosyltransferase